MSVSDFIKLPKKENIDAEIKNIEQSLFSLGQESEIKTKSKLLTLKLPSFDIDKFNSNLTGNSFTLITEQAEELTKSHIKHTLDQNGEKWLEYGVGKIENNQCPFCKQSILNVDIVTLSSHTLV